MRKRQLQTPSIYPQSRNSALEPLSLAITLGGLGFNDLIGQQLGSLRVQGIRDENSFCS